ncbi:Protein of unknown function [Pyronema omphalodes CBS 100304]|uniref:Uncharacterized protein n=1 Tax=Pyronema omphalodes (strain CBS 100304) TaxID=1076935 RepID=U4LP17_PYROM|nr:Protein of unknown function [Pyronema omphalodes CBS 100304]
MQRSRFTVDSDCPNHAWWYKMLMSKHRMFGGYISFASEQTSGEIEIGCICTPTEERGMSSGVRRMHKRHQPTRKQMHVSSLLGNSK